ncbi:hypothetical protein VP01_956g1 [Puccinia sorghi]|uniref:Uncharacterized protein n=1 Tax=Puccinia sorghi TaxID=27349 RepID=A0A0L6U689_9BASI|nr:hypothetical protein VP01_956g1 [Puccinia sorghi]
MVFSNTLSTHRQLHLPPTVQPQTDFSICLIQYHHFLWKTAIIYASFSVKAQLAFLDTHRKHTIIQILEHSIEEISIFHSVTIDKFLLLSPPSLTQLTIPATMPKIKPATNQPGKNVMIRVSLQVHAAMTNTLCLQMYIKLSKHGPKHLNRSTTDNPTPIYKINQLNLVEGATRIIYRKGLSCFYNYLTTHAGDILQKQNPSEAESEFLLKEKQPLFPFCREGKSPKLGSIRKSGLTKTDGIPLQACQQVEISFE